MSTLKNFKPKSNHPIWGVLMFLMVFSCQDLNMEDLKSNDLSELDESLSKVVPGRYIVTLHSNEFNFRESDKYEDVQNGIRKISNEILVKHNIQNEKLQSVYGHALNGFAMDLTDEEYQKLKKDRRVKSIEPDIFLSDIYNYRKTPPGKEQPDDGGDGGVSDPTGPFQSDAPKYLDRIDQRNLPLNGIYSYPATGAGVIAYMAPGAIRTDIEDFEGRAGNVILVEEGDHNSGISTIIANNIGGRIFGSAKGINLVGVRSYNPTNHEMGEYLSGLLAGYDWILANGQRPAVVIINLVGPLESPTYFSALENLYNAGFSLFSSSGMWNEDACTWANSYKPYVFTVGLTDLDDKKQWSSNYGDCVDLFTTSTYDGYEELWGNGWGMNPNYVAAGVVAGTAALFLESNPNASPAEVYQFLRNTSTKNVVKLSNSVNNHLLFNGLTMEGAGEIDPNRVNHVLDLIGNSTKLKGNDHSVRLEWNDIQNPSGKIDIFVNGNFYTTTNASYVWTEVLNGRNLPARNYKICLSGTNQCSNEVTVTF
jgi:hypothetical protein